MLLIFCQLEGMQTVFRCTWITFYPRGGGGGTLGISKWGCAAGTLELLAYTRASSAEFCSCSV